MNKHTKIVLAVLAIFIVGMTLSVAFAEPVSAKSFKSKGYKWNIKNSKWNKMKKQANKYRKFFKSHGSDHPGYSKAVTVKVTKNGHSYKGYAMVVKNAKNQMRCEVRGATPYYLKCYV